MPHHFLRTTLAIAAVGSAVFGTALGCSSGSNGGSTTAAGRDDFIAKYCAEFSPCCAKVGRPTDGATCRAFITAFATPTYDAAAANDCLAEVHAAAASPTFCDNSSNASGPSCKKVFAKAGGAAKPGDLCTKDEDCASSTEGTVRCQSIYKSGAEIRKCQVQVAGKVGDAPCVGTVDGSITSFSGSSSATDVAPKGYLCDLATGVYCDGTSGKCTAVGKVGETCSGSSSSYSCVKTAYCDYATKTCTIKKAVGDTCTSFPDQCSDGSYCDDTTKKCVVALAEGAACTSSRTCASGSCVNTKCAKKGSGDIGLAFLCGGG